MTGFEPVTVINFSEFERSFSPFHPSGDCRNRAGSASNGYKKRRIAVDPPFFYIPGFPLWRKKVHSVGIFGRRTIRCSAVCGLGRRGLILRTKPASLKL